jgi:hypothetical protein
MMDSDRRPTLPRLKNLSARGGLLAALSLLEAIQARSLTPAELAAWYRSTFAMGVATVSEPGAGVFVLAGMFTDAQKPAFDELLGRARQRVVDVLRRVLDKTAADPLAIAIERRWVSDEQEVILLDPASSLSDALIALFAGDRQGDPEAYEQRLSVCLTCGRVGFAEARRDPLGCFEHVRGALTSR